MQKKLNIIQCVGLTLLPVLGIVFGATQNTRGASESGYSRPSNFNPRQELNDNLDNVTNDTALYQRLSDITVPKAPEYQANLKPLKNSEHLHREKLPPISRNPRLKGAMSRIEKQTYQPSSPTYRR